MAEKLDISMLTNEQIGTYRRAFIDAGADYLIMDGWAKQWMRDDVAQLEPLGFLEHCPEASERESDGQYTADAYRPTSGFLAALKDQPQ